MNELERLPTEGGWPAAAWCTVPDSGISAEELTEETIPDGRLLPADGGPCGHASHFHSGVSRRGANDATVRSRAAVLDATLRTARKPGHRQGGGNKNNLSLIHISEPTRPY